MLTLLFQELPAVGSIIQILGAALIVSAGFGCFIIFPEKKIGITIFEINLAAVCVLSAIANLGAQSAFSAAFSFVFAAVTLSLATIVRRVDYRSLLFCFATTLFVMVVLIYVFHFQAIIASLNDNSEARWALRLRPFGWHHNLTGYNFGGGVILCGYAAARSNGWRRLTFIIGVPLCLSMELAASHRSSIIALVASTAVIGVLFAHRLRGRARRYAVIGGSTMVALLAIFSARVGRYIWTVLELDSRARGLATGGTGRTGIWANMVDQAFQNRETVFTGLGLRAATVSEIGSSSENSYLNILIESGVIVGGIYILLMVRTAIGSVAGAWHAPRGQSLDRIAIAWLLSYALIESFFNRYLLAIGNPMSLMVLTVFMHAALLERQARLPVTRVAPRTARTVLRRARRVVREPAALAPAK